MGTWCHITRITARPGWHESSQTTAPVLCPGHTTNSAEQTVPHTTPTLGLQRVDGVRVLEEVQRLAQRLARHPLVPACNNKAAGGQAGGVEQWGALVETVMIGCADALCAPQSLFELCWTPGKAQP